MKTIWKIVILSIAIGVVLSIAGLSLGASRDGLYLDKTGVHLISHNETRITEPDLESFKDISVDVDYSNVEFAVSDKYGIDIRGYDGDWDWELTDGVLRITNRRPDTRASFFVFNTNKNYENYVKIYLPQEAQLETVYVKTGSGNVNIGGFNAVDVQIGNSYGKIDLYSITSNNLQIGINSGNFTGMKLNAQNISCKIEYGRGSFEGINANKFTAESSSGDFTLRDCIVGDIAIKNEYGKILAEGLYSSKTNIEVESGDISLSGEFSGETVIRSSYGGVKFSTSKEKVYYDFDISTEYGKIVFDNDNIGSNTTIKSSGVSEHKVNIATESGDVEVYFIK